MADKILTFLGTGELFQTKYSLADHDPITTYYLAEALAAFFPGHEVSVFATGKAMEEYGASLRNALSDRGCRPCYIPVPELTDPGQMWTVFAKVAEAVQDGDRVVFDITHSYRSLPLLVLLALSYLRVVRNFELEALLYAPYAEHDSSPVHDLRPFLDLLDWTTATHLFLTTGNADSLSDQLAKEPGLDLGFSPTTLTNAAAALRLHRPDEARALTWQMVQALRPLDTEAVPASVRPFGTLAKRLQTSFEAMTPEAPNPLDLQQELRQELAMIHWNANQGQWAAAVTLAREGLVSLVCWHAGWTEIVDGIPRWQDAKWRDKAEKALNRLADVVVSAGGALRASGQAGDPDEVKLKQCAVADLNKATGSLPDGAKAAVSRSEDYAFELGRTWDLVRHLRNDLNHAGKVTSTATRTVSELLAQARAVPARLDVVYAMSGLNP